MATEHCPDCGEPIKPRAKSCPCGWRVEPAPKAGDIAAADRNRCAYQVEGRRCRNVGTISDSTRAGGDLHCRWHYGEPRPAEAMRALEVSEQQVPADFDYSAKAIVKLTHDAYLARPVRPA